MAALSVMLTVKIKANFELGHLIYIRMLTAPHLFSAMLLAPELNISNVSSTSLTIKWAQKCDSNPNYRIACNKDGLGYRLNISVDETVTADLENVSNS